MQKKPILTVFAGPNGSGKSTVTSKYPLPEYYVNADEIERQCNCTQLEAAKIAENTREYLLAQKESFAFETVLSTDRNINLIRRAKAAGYYIVVVFITTNNPSINIRRVQARIAAGGNKVDLEKIEPRYWRALRNIKAVYPYCDEFTLTNAVAVDLIASQNTTAVTYNPEFIQPATGQLKKYGNCSAVLKWLSSSRNSP